MSYHNGPKITTNGLIFCIDAADTNSYPGSGTSIYNLADTSSVGELGVAGLFQPTYISTTNNKYFVFNGTNTLIRIPNSTSLDVNSVSVEVWIKTNNANQNGFWFEKGTVNTQYSLFQEGTNIQWRHNISGVGMTNLTTSSTTTAGLNATDWFQITGTYVSGSRKLYVNGVLKNSDTRTGNISVNAGGMSIGAYGGYNGGRSYYYNGNLAIVRVYSKSLEDYEVLNNFKATKSRFGL